jgi:polyisoprenoid-binding protein YceI
VEGIGRSGRRGTPRASVASAGFGVLLAAVASQACGVAALAQTACPADLPPGVACGGKDIAAATAGTYALDPNHAAVLARVSHLGYSYSVFRFDRVEATLVWDPAAIAASTLSAAVETASVATNVPGFAAQIAGDEFLKSAAFPEATFVSTAFHPIDGTHGTVEGQFTLMGKTHPMTFDVALSGAGAGFGQPRMGISARATLDPQAYGLPAMMIDPIELVVDAEFERKP